MKLNTILTGGFLFIALATSLLIGITAFSMFNEIAKDEIPAQRALGSINAASNALLSEIREYVLLGDKEAKADILTAKEEIQRSIELYASRPEADRPRQAAILKEITAVTSSITEEAENIIRLYEEKGQAEALASLEDMEEKENEIGKALQSAEDIVEEDINKSTLFFYAGIFSTIIISVIISMLVSFIISKRISEAHNNLTREVGEISKGNFSIQLQNSNITEIQSLTDSLNRILASMKLAILKTGVTKEELGMGEVIKAKKEAEEEAEKRRKELERFAKLAEGRELKMIELKKKIKELEKKVNKR